MNPLARDQQIVRTICDGAIPRRIAHVFIEQQTPGADRRRCLAKGAFLMSNRDVMENIKHRYNVELSLRPGIFLADMFEAKTSVTVPLRHAGRTIDSRAGGVEPESSDTELKAMEEAEK